MRALTVWYSATPPEDDDREDLLLLDWPTVRSMARLTLAEAMINAGDVNFVVIVGQLAAKAGWRLFVGRPVHFATNLALVGHETEVQLAASGKIRERQLS